MDSNLVSLNRVFLNISNPANRELVFNQGEILRGLVKETDANGMVKLLIQGQFIEAMAEADVNPGQSLHLLVEEVRPGRVSLKILTPEAINRVEQANLATQLKEMGITPGPEIVKLARVLLDNHLPVNRQTLGEGMQIMHRLGGDTPQNLAVTAWAIKNQLPASPAILERVAAFFNSKADFIQVYTQLVRLLADLPEFRYSLQNLPLLPEQIPGQAAAAIRPGTDPFSLPAGQLLASDGEAALFNPTQPTAPASQAGSTQGAAFERENIILSTWLKAVNPTVSGPDRPLGNPEIISRLLQYVQNLLLATGVDGKEAATVMSAKLQQNIQTRPQLFQSLVSIQSILDQVQPGNIKELQQLISLVKIFEHELTGQQIVNTASRLSPESNFPGIYLSFPIQLDKEYYSVCELRVNREQRPTRNELDSLRVAISLDTSQLGQVLFYLEWKRIGSLDIQGVVEDEVIRSYFTAHWQELSERLEELGYQVNNLGIKVVPSQQELETLRPDPAITRASSLRPISIDVTI